MSDPTTRHHSQRAWFKQKGSWGAGLKPVWAADPKDQPTKGKRQKEAILEENLCGVRS
jgi:hypothetical protein